MTHRKFGTLALVLAVPLLARTATAREGLAAYHLHTDAMVTAARYEPRGSQLRVTNPRNGRSVVVTVNDRGPFNGNRILDLSTAAFAELFGGLGRGVGPITYEVISSGATAGGGSPEGGVYLASRGGTARSRSWRSRHYRSHRHR